jgi:tRNA pseudouridine32 synthase/23S rRNA pseudouridine746 synthase
MQPGLVAGQVALMRGGQMGPCPASAAAPLQGRRVVLKAFSGQMTEEWVVPGWAGPLAAITASSQQYAGYRRLTEQLSARIQAMQAAIQQHQQGEAAPGAGGSPGPAAEQGRRRRRQQQRAGRQLEPALEPLQQQQALLAAKRKALSHELLLLIQGSYGTQDLQGRRLQLLDVYAQHCAQTGAQPNCLARSGGPPASTAHAAASRQAQRARQRPAAAPAEPGRGAPGAGAAPPAWAAAAGAAPPQLVSFPGGTGDCCAPKLIHAALQAGLRPRGLVEFWYGAPPGGCWWGAGGWRPHATCARRPPPPRVSIF